jgi:adenine-specific DNA-methyltransferase
MIYGIRSNGNQHGLVLTKPIVVDLMLDRVGYSPYSDLREIKVIEPAAGDGAFAISIIDRLYKSSLKFDFSFQNALSNLNFYEIDEHMANKLTERIESRLAEYFAALPNNLIHREDFLLSNACRCNLIIGNPPYVRHENIPETLKKEYRKKFTSFNHRSDLYIAFYDKALNLLHTNGILSFICSNRWLKNQYGKSLRYLISLAYSVDEIIDLEGSCPFEEEVIAYPAITTIHKSTVQKRQNYYHIHDINELAEIDNRIKPSRKLNISNPLDWFSYKPNGLIYEKFIDSIENQGFKIGIGVATGSDKVFIRKDFESIVEKGLLIPILTSKDLKNNQLKWSGNYILNPFERFGSLVDLDKHPKAKAYLESKRNLLLKRHVAKKNPSAWYKTIDRITPQLLHKDKIILPDISGNSYLFIDRGNFYPHHNLYYITGREYDKLELLAAILMSSFVKIQLLELGNKMNGGYPRWQSQNLKKLRVPIIDAIPAETARTLSRAYQKRDYDQINNIITKEEIAGYCFSVRQTKLFEPEPEDYKDCKDKKDFI